MGLEGFDKVPPTCLGSLLCRFRQGKHGYGLGIIPGCLSFRGEVVVGGQPSGSEVSSDHRLSRSLASRAL